MTIIGTAELDVHAKTDKVDDEIVGATKSAAARGAEVLAAGLVTQKVTQFLGDATRAAVDLGENQNKVNVVFGESSEKVLEFAANASSAIGQSEAQALGAAGTFGNLFRAIELTEEQSAEMATSLVTLASDLASFNNVDPTEALDALRAGLVGETEPLKRFGINMNEATLQAKAMEMGLQSTAENGLDPATKAQAAYALILEQSSLAQGDFERTSEGLANQQRILNAQFEDAKAKIGEALIPVLSKAADAVSTLFDAFKALPDPIEDTIAAVGGLGAAVGVGAIAVGSIVRNLRDLGVSLPGTNRNLKTLAGNADEAAVAAGTLGSKVAALARTGAIVITVSFVVKEIAGGVADWVEDRVKEAGRKLSEIPGFVGAALNVRDKGLGGAADAMFGDVTEKERDLKNATEATAEASEDAAKKAAELAEKREEQAAASRKAYLEELKLAGGFTAVLGAQFSAADAEAELAKVREKVERLAERGRQGTKKYQDARQDLERVSVEAIEAELGLATAVVEYADETEKGGDKQERVNRILEQLARRAGVSDDTLSDLRRTVQGLGDDFDTLRRKASRPIELQVATAFDDSFPNTGGATPPTTGGGGGRGRGRQRDTSTPRSGGVVLQIDGKKVADATETRTRLLEGD